MTAIADPGLAPIETILEDARNGRMFILVDAEDRENEGDLIIPGQFATPAAVNFMATHGRGLICLSLTEARAEALKLKLMSSDNRSRHQTAFTVSIEAREGVSTGISAHDRARTIAVAVDPTKSAEDIVTPGHVFPLVARDGGVLVRAGHTEASVDISRLAGLGPSGVICEIMRDDGKMARLPDLEDFAHKHGLHIGTIEDLIAYRLRHDRIVERRVESRFESEHGGPFRLIAFRNTLDGVEHVALVKDRISADKPALVRMHKVDFACDVIGEAGPRAGLVGAAIAALDQAEEAGVIVLIRESRPTAISERFGAEGEGDGGQALREYGVGAQILLDLGVREMILLSNHEKRIVGLDGYGLKVVGVRGFGAETSP